MLIRTSPTTPVQWIPETDPAIDFEKWPKTDRENYFGFGPDAHFRLPPIKPGETPFVVHLRPLSNGDYFRIMSLAEQHGKNPLEVPECRREILRATVSGIDGAFEEQGGKLIAIGPDVLFGPDGKLSEDGLSFFSAPILEVGCAVAAWMISLPRFGSHSS